MSYADFRRSETHNPSAWIDLKAGNHWDLRAGYSHLGYDIDAPFFGSFGMSDNTTFLQGHRFRSLSFSRMERQSIFFQQVDLRSRVRDIMREFEPDTARRNIEWHIGLLLIPAINSEKSSTSGYDGVKNIRRGHHTYIALNVWDLDENHMITWRERIMKKVLSFVFVVFAGLNCSNAFGEIPPRLTEDVKIIVIIEYSSDTHSTMYLDGARKEAASLGFRLEIMDARNDRENMAKMLDNAVLQQADAILVSHGSPDDLLKGVKRALRRKIPVVAFDCEIPLPDVVKIDQDDHKMAELGLNRIVHDTHGKAKLVQIWVGGYAPADKRMETFQSFIPNHPGIEEIERFGKVTNNTALQTQVMMKSVLQKYPRGAIDVVWANWDEYAKGAARAIRDAGRDEIKLYGVDVSDEDLAMIQDPENPWVATVGVAPKAIGSVQVRIAAHLLAGEPVPERYSLAPVLIAREMLPADQPVSMATLHHYVPGFGETTDFLPPWMLELKAKYR